ncbi:probable structural maintenance of chromosomes protein 5 at C-terminar half [Coccomyxa sp. Obi]|nr:probable structural maintenance of chromosomes protein 5 at C-terminar half [Coccomyxa sp. Obi]
MQALLAKEEYEERSVRIRKLREQVGGETDISSRSPLLGGQEGGGVVRELRRMVGVVSHHFSRSMRAIGCAGEVQLYCGCEIGFDSCNNFDKYVPAHYTSTDGAHIFKSYICPSSHISTRHCGSSASVLCLTSQHGIMAQMTFSIANVRPQVVVNIVVKFRDEEEMQLPTAHRQSGGECAVCTILYIIALQHVTVCPFRVVDEINQGMDQINEHKVFVQMVEAACRPGTPQCFMFTPKLLPDLPYTRDVYPMSIFNGVHCSALTQEFQGAGDFVAGMPVVYTG